MTRDEERRAERESVKNPSASLLALWEAQDAWDTCYAAMRRVVQYGGYHTCLDLGELTSEIDGDVVYVSEQVEGVILRGCDGAAARILIRETGADGAN